MDIKGTHQGQPPTAETMVNGSSSFETGQQPVDSQAFNSQSPPPYALNLHIDQLTLHGFSTLDRDLIGIAIQAELTRLFTEQGIPNSLGQESIINQLNGEAFEMVAGIPPRVIGIRIAQSIYQGLRNA